jgi:hypothetical protein
MRRFDSDPRLHLFSNIQHFWKKNKPDRSENCSGSVQLVGAFGNCPPTLSLFTGLREMRLGPSILQGLSFVR